MKKLEKMEALAQPSIAYYFGFGGIELKRIEYGIDNYIIFVAGAWSDKPEIHRSRVYYTAKGNNYIMYRGCRISLSDCIRM